MQNNKFSNFYNLTFQFENEDCSIKYFALNVFYIDIHVKHIDIDILLFSFFIIYSKLNCLNGKVYIIFNFINIHFCRINIP